MSGLFSPKKLRDHEMDVNALGRQRAREALTGGAKSPRDMRRVFPSEHQDLHRRAYIGHSDPGVRIIGGVCGEVHVMTGDF